MSSETETNLADAFAETLDSAEAALSADDEVEGDDRRDDGTESEALDALRERLADLSSDVDEASTSELLAAAGVSPNGVEGDEGGDGSGDSLGPADLPHLLDSADDESVGTLQQLLDLAELGSDAPEDDAAFGERLREVLGDDGGGTEDVEGAPDDDGEETDGEETDTGESVEEEDGLPTVADVVSGSVSFARDWSDARKAVTGDDGSDGDGADDGDEADAEDDGWLDFDDFPELDEGVDGEDRDSGSRGGRQSRYSTLPGSRSDMGRATRFSSVKARK